MNINASRGFGVGLGMTTRRDFLRTTAVASGALLAGTEAVRSALLRGPRSGLALAAGPVAGMLPALAASPKKILVLGGTGYIGPHIVRHAVSRGHSVTIFTRGRRDADLPESVERLVGDRAITDDAPTGQLDALRGRRWDAVIDDSATDPRWVRSSAEVLKDSGRYMFVSSTGVFLPYLTDDLDEKKEVRAEPEELLFPELPTLRSSILTLVHVLRSRTIRMFLAWI